MGKDEPPIAAHESDQLSEDYLIAIQLQDALNEEERNFHHRLRQNNGISHVQVTTGYERLFDESQPESVEHDEEDEEDYDDYAEYENEFSYFRSTKTWNKPNGRLSFPEHKEMVTKHDSIVCGARNTETLESQISIDCGNMMGANVSLPNPVF